MRTLSLSLGGYPGKAWIPDEVCFAFNPNFVELETQYPNNIEVSVSLVLPYTTQDIGLARTRSVTVTPYNGKLKVYLSRLFELMFEEPKLTRSLELEVNISDVDETQGGYFRLLCIWGSIALGERFNAYGVFNEDVRKRYFERKVIWFRKFPFKLSLYKYARDLTFQGRFDDGRYLSGDLVISNTRNCSLSLVDDFTENASVNDTSTITPMQLVYLARERKLVGIDNGGLFYSNWIANDEYGFMASSECLKDGKPMEDIDFSYCDANTVCWTYRWNGSRMVNCGIRHNVGFFDVEPSKFFNTAQRSATIKYKISADEKNNSVFDATFDYTFIQPGTSVALVNLIVCNDTVGDYLRWIDRQGCLQYFLFVKGKQTIKNKLGSNIIFEKDAVGDMYFGNLTRVGEIMATDSRKCCAVHLTPDIFQYVSSILTSPLIDLYIGKDGNGDEIWIPVNIEAGSVNYDPKTMLHDLELSYSAPSPNAQIL